jgi:hypothetical protein
MFGLLLMPEVRWFRKMRMFLLVFHVYHGADMGRAQDATGAAFKISRNVVRGYREEQKQQTAHTAAECITAMSL